MFKKETTSEIPISELQFIAIYDSLSKPAAISLYNKVSKRYKCIAWSEKIYKENEAKCTNYNKRLYLVDSLIETNLQDPTIVPKTISEGAIFKCQGPMSGITIKQTAIDELSDKPIEEWKSFLEDKIKQFSSVPFILSFPFLFITKLYLKFRKDKKAKLAYYFAATQAILDNGMLNDFMNDK